MTRFFSEQNHAQQARSGGRLPRAASLQSSASARDLYFILLSLHTSPRPRTCAVNCAFCCSAATRRCNSASSASPSSAIFGVWLPTFRRVVCACAAGPPTPTSGSRGVFLFHVFFRHRGRMLSYDCFRVAG